MRSKEPDINNVGRGNDSNACAASDGKPETEHTSRVRVMCCYVDASKLMEDSLDEIWIAVMGVTGAGKSRFISACTGKDVKIGHSLESCKSIDLYASCSDPCKGTTEVDDYSFVWKDKRVHLIDTPGKFPWYNKLTSNVGWMCLCPFHIHLLCLAIGGQNGRTTFHHSEIGSAIP